ncbi:hypothetical protein [Kordia sp.]|uniref:hypothetical protein n=1 Tax=Kordia sp. TaxID=1965332 RepID=UPI003D6C0F63
MTKRNLLSLFIITSLVLFSCEKKQEVVQNPQWDYKNIKGFGNSKLHQYTICGIVPIIKTQQCKTGLWTFYSPQNVKIAEGTFNPKLIEINDHGGCPFSFYSNSMDAKKWKFWDSNGKPIPTNKRDLDFILNYGSDPE